jgi:hypothetical protein
MSNRAVIAAAALAGSVVRITRGPFRSAVRALPGVAGAAAVACGCGEVVQRVFGRGLGWPAGLVVAGVFVLWFGAELNRVPPAPRRQDDGA